MKHGDDPEIGSVWDISYEDEFRTADNLFPRVIDWLDDLERCGPPFERSVSERIVANNVSDEQFIDTVHCVVSLAARSPKLRHEALGYGLNITPESNFRERNNMIGANMRSIMPNVLRSLEPYGKVLIIFSPEREFIFGDGFFQNLTVNGELWHRRRILVPITPWMSVLYVREGRFFIEPRLMTLVISRFEADQLNNVIKAYSKETVFYRLEKPEMDDNFASGQFMYFKDQRNPVDDLIFQIPGVYDDRDRTEELEAFLDRYARNDLND